MFIIRKIKNYLVDIRDRLNCIEKRIGSLVENDSSKEALNEIQSRLNLIERKVDVVVADIANETHKYDTHERLVHIEDRVKEANMFLQKLNEDTWVYGHAIEKAIASNMQPSQRPRVHFIRCLDRYNTGDLNCGPELFFQDFAVRFSCFYHSIKDINYTIIRPDDWVILGGGGMIDCNEEYQSEINNVLHACKHVISWAMGHNHHYSDCIFAWKSIFPIDMTAFELFTTRDWEYNGQRYCPCVSCMMPELDIVYEKKRRIAVYEHHQIPIDILPDVEHMTNSAPIYRVLKYIGEAEVLITNSYHGAYWGILMKKKVIIYKPFSNKYEFFKYSPTIYSGNLEEDIARTNVYPEALRECRELNLNLRDEIVNMISEEEYQAHQFVLMDKPKDNQPSQPHYVYCADLMTTPKNGYRYNMDNVFDADYYDSDSAAHIQAIAVNGYWGTANGVGSLDAVKKMLKKAQAKNEVPSGINIDALTDGEALAATQAAIWHYGNSKPGSQRVNSTDPVGVYFLGYDSNGYETHKNVNQDSAARVKALFNYLLSAPSPETDTTTPLITEKNFATNASITVGEKAKDSEGNVLKDDKGNEMYNADISFRLEIEKSKLTGNLAVTVLDKDGKELAKKYLVTDDTNLLGQLFAEGEVDANGNYTISGLQIAER